MCLGSSVRGMSVVYVSFVPLFSYMVQSVSVAFILLYNITINLGYVVKCQVSVSFDACLSLHLPSSLGTSEQVSFFWLDKTSLVLTSTRQHLTEVVPMSMPNTQ